MDQDPASRPPVLLYYRCECGGSQLSSWSSHTQRWIQCGTWLTVTLSGRPQDSNSLEKLRYRFHWLGLKSDVYCFCILPMKPGPAPIIHLSIIEGPLKAKGHLWPRVHSCAHILKAVRGEAASKTGEIKIIKLQKNISVIPDAIILIN